MFVALYFANLFGSFVNHWTLGCIWSHLRVEWWHSEAQPEAHIGLAQTNERWWGFCIDCMEQHCFAQVFMGLELSFCDSLIPPIASLTLIWARWGTSVSITGPVFRLSQNYEWKWGILDSRECTAAFWLDWINNWWLNICSHVIIILWQSWPFESIKLNGDLLVFKLRPDPVVTLTVISFIPRSQILMHIQVFS